ncbi:glycoside hydrolase family 3 C-terminal domain-containing protein [Curtobacterium sp. MCPF17_052]|uniref:beta-glucosidase n=1 Tax=Curtobacterium sp. MCPF17_052 TaxID=2175655 RepID=UPI0024DFCEA7|nr:glycoside hydrolase family 3 C-terminal domain-containing protein [Curtobacterium sp. MCPF17_052]WIB11417.1 glycoside hydrolase family 3 C-terminal domain-containing protein [Curtobacterium sp. MCPF17_052]
MFSGVTYPAQVPCTPLVSYADGPDYVRGPAGVTVFPSQISLASTFDSGLAYDKGAAQADEAFRSGKNGLLAPGLHSGRTPLSGRTPDYLGEDSYLAGTMAGAAVDGIQTGNPTEPVMAVVKHYIANEQELDRQTSSSNVDGRTLREVYDLPFRIAIAKGDPAGVMCSYNQINGVYGCENPLLKNVLKKDDGFRGYVVSDFGAVHSTAPSLNAGLDQELNRPRFYTPANIGAAIDTGQVTEAQVTAAAHRVVRSYIASGLFDHPLPTTPSTSSSTPANKAVARQVAEQGSVLLKNSANALPLTKSNRTIAVIGATASATATNGISAASVCAMPNFGPPVSCPNVVAPLDAIRERAAAVGATVTFDPGTDKAKAAAVAAAADTVVVFGYALQGEGADRTTLALDGDGDALISAVAAANPDTVVVLETGSATTMPWLADVRSVVEAWYPGEQQGNALARLLYGDVDFSGKLPMTFPKSLADIPTSTPSQYPGLVNGEVTRPAGSTVIRQVAYSEGLAVGHKWYESKGIEPLFAFGHGLSYTSFSWSDLRVDRRGSGADTRLTVRFSVRNTGSTAGTATPQVYLTLPTAAAEPGKRLVAFSDVTLRPGERRTVKATVDAGSPDEPLSIWDTTTHDWSVALGTYGISVGDAVDATPLSTTVSVR